MIPPSSRRTIRTVDGGHTWLKSSYSGTEGNCVEVTPGFVRDSKAPTTRMPLSAAAWQAFLDSAKALSNS